MSETASPTAKPLGEILETGARYLEGKGVEHPRLACELLAGRLLNCKPLELNMKLTLPLDERRLEAMRRGVRRVAAGEPVQYVLGETEFMGHTFRVDRRALIPRPETEVLVERVLACTDAWAGSPRVVDLGTGTGCIAISLALAKPEAFLMALDTSAEALVLAKENATQLGVADRIAFECGELGDAVEPHHVDLIVANLPYVATSDYESLPPHIRDFEPRTALDGGPDGLVVIGSAVEDAYFALRPGGFLFLEIGADQARATTTLMENAGFECVVTTKDLAGRDRIVSGTLTPLPAP